MSGSEHYWVYMLQVRNGNYYTGITTNPHRRYMEHVRGKARCLYTTIFPPKRLVQCWKVYDSRGTALRIEHFIKKRPRQVKTDLVRNPQNLSPMLSRGSITGVRIEPCPATLLDDINSTEKGKTPGKRR